MMDDGDIDKYDIIHGSTVEFDARALPLQGRLEGRESDPATMSYPYIITYVHSLIYFLKANFTTVLASGHC